MLSKKKDSSPPRLVAQRRYFLASPWLWAQGDVYIWRSPPHAVPSPCLLRSWWEGTQVLSCWLALHQTKSQVYPISSREKLTTTRTGGSHHSSATAASTRPRGNTVPY